MPLGIGKSHLLRRNKTPLKTLIKPLYFSLLTLGLYKLLDQGLKVKLGGFLEEVAHCFVIRVPSTKCTSNWASREEVTITLFGLLVSQIDSDVVSVGKEFHAVWHVVLVDVIQSLKLPIGIEETVFSSLHCHRCALLPVQRVQPFCRLGQ